MVTYGTKTWGLREAERCHLNVFDMNCLKPIGGITRWNSDSNGGKYHRECGLKNVTVVWAR